MLRRLELVDMDAAARVLRTAFDHALPALAGLHTPKEDQWFFRERVFRTYGVWGAFDAAAMIGMLAFREDWIVVRAARGSGAWRWHGTAAGRPAFFDRLHLWTFQCNARARQEALRSSRKQTARQMRRKSRMLSIVGRARSLPVATRAAVQSRRYFATAPSFQVNPRPCPRAVTVPSTISIASASE